MAGNDGNGRNEKTRVALEEFSRKFHGTVLKDFGSISQYTCMDYCEKDWVGCECECCGQKSTREYPRVLEATSVRKSKRNEFKRKSFVIDTNTKVSLVVGCHWAHNFENLDYGLRNRRKYEAVLRHLSDIQIYDYNSLIIPGKLLTHFGDCRTYFAPRPNDPDEILVIAGYNDEDQLELWKERGMKIDAVESINWSGRKGDCGIIALGFDIDRHHPETIETGQYKIVMK